MTTVHPRSASEPCSTSAPFAWSTFLMGDSLPFSASRLRIFMALVSTLKIDGRLTFSAVRASHLRPGWHSVTAGAERAFVVCPPGGHGALLLRHVALLLHLHLPLLLLLLLRPSHSPHAAEE